MLKKFLTLTLFATAILNVASAQKRDHKKEPSEEVSQEDEEDEPENISEKPTVKYGTNIIRIAPITGMDLGVGFGLSYEKIFGRDGMIGLVLPVSYIMEDRGDGFFTGTQDVSSNHGYLFFTPGLKIYPFGQRKVTYAFGVNLMLGYGGGKEWRGYLDNPLSGSVKYELTDITKYRLGALVNNYVNFQISPSFNLGLDAGFGVRYINRQKETGPVGGSRTYHYGMGLTGQASLTLGFRF